MKKYVDSSDDGSESKVTPPLGQLTNKTIHITRFVQESFRGEHAHDAQVQNLKTKHRVIAIDTPHRVGEATKLEGEVDICNNTLTEDHQNQLLPSLDKVRSC